ncbi:tail protein X [Campylobacter sputorum]|uniref:tail protein X n=1 Tax=Campylobacter sputorum TaxID=206 RepID=UPI00053BF0DC|nr:tail protein X [Campylobacter sputorum]
MKQYIAKDNDTLDMICYKHYKTLDKTLYQQFLLANNTLLSTRTLKAGDIVNLPDITIQQKPKVKYLWE